MSKVKSFLLTFIKPLVLAHVQDLSMLDPLVAKVLVDKAHLDPTMAGNVASDVTAVVEAALTDLINKL